MKNDSFPSTGIPDNMLDFLNIMLLEKFRKYNSNGNKLFCSYMSVGQKYENELLVIGREPSYWPEDFSISELNKEMGATNVFKTKVLHHALYGNDSLCPLKYVTDLWGNTENRYKYNTSYNTMLDPFWSCVKEIVMKLGICKDKTNWSSCIALTYLYKIAYSSNRYLFEKPRLMQFEHCREILHLELSILKPKRVLFLTGMKHAQDFLYLSDCKDFNKYTCPLGDFDYESHIAQTVVSVNPKKYPRDEVVNLILTGFRVTPT
jgi:hypothetical protein